jgi:hypothetical protein
MIGLAHLLVNGWQEFPGADFGLLAMLAKHFTDIIPQTCRNHFAILGENKLSIFRIPNDNTNRDG